MTTPRVGLGRWVGLVCVVMLSGFWLVLTRKVIAVPAFLVFVVLLGATTPLVSLGRWASVVCVALLSGWLVLTRKVIPVPAVQALLVFVVLIGGVALGTPRKSVRAALAVFLLATLSPLDVTFRNVDGPPRIVPYVMGLPTPATLERARRGDVVLGGCVVFGFEPMWAVVW